MTALKYWDSVSGTYRVLTGPPGPIGPPGPGLPLGGATNQVLGKLSAADENTGWIGPMLPLVGGTLTGNLSITGAAGSGREVFGQTAGSNRWAVVLGNATPEAAGNVGSDFYIQRFDNSGNQIDTPIGIFRSSGAVAIKGSNTNDSPSPGYVGEVIYGISATPALTTNATANLVSISLTPGDWDIQGEVWVNVGAGGASLVSAGISPTSQTFPASAQLTASRATIMATLPASSTQVFSLRPCQMQLAATAPMFLIVVAVFPSGTTTASGLIWARRRR